ncbi:MAG: tyrosine-type recombinase/integrase [Planctomycetota bacterium]
MRRPKPFFRKQTRTWYVQLGKKQINLGPDEDKAWAKYHELMLDRDEPTAAVTSVLALLDERLDWLNRRRKQSTYAKAKHYLNSFARSIPAKLTVDKLSARHIAKWIEVNSGWNPNTLNDAISTVQAAFNWGVKHERILRNPVTYVPDKPARRRREVVFSAEQWTLIRSEVSDCFGDLLDFLWETGCRPLEARSIEARHVDLENDLIHFPPSEAKGELRDRVIYLTELSRSIIEKRVHRDGPLFVNRNGRPWTKDAIACRFKRLREKLGQPMCAYAIRHSFATEGLKAGCDSLTLAQLMGHSDTTMISRTYAHLARNPEYLREQARKLKG